MSIFQFDKARRIARRVRAFLRNPRKVLRRRMMDPKSAQRRRSIRSKKHDFRQVRSEIKSKRREEYGQLTDRISRIKNDLKGNKRETKRIDEELAAAQDPAEISEHEERRRRAQQERSRLIAERLATKRRRERRTSGARGARRERSRRSLWPNESSAPRLAGQERRSRASYPTSSS